MDFRTNDRVDVFDIMYVKSVPCSAIAPVASPLVQVVRMFVSLPRDMGRPAFLAIPEASSLGVMLPAQTPKRAPLSFAAGHAYETRIRIRWLRY